MSSLGQKLKVILWKSYILRRRHWLLSLFEVFAPLFLFYLFTKYGVSNSSGQEYEINSVKNLDDIVRELSGDDTYATGRHSRVYIDTGFRQIGLAPFNQNTMKIINDLENKLSRLTPLRGSYNTTHFSKEAQLNKWLSSQSDDDITIGIAVVEYNSKTKLHYSIRMHKDNTPPLDELFGYKWEAESYFTSWFLMLQMILDANFINECTKKNFNIGLQEFPDKAHERENFANIVFPFVTTFSFVFIIPAILKKVVEEKLSGIKELQKMMGLHSWMLWAGWLVHALMVYGVSIIIITIMFEIPWEARSNLLYQVDGWLVIWYLFMIFIITTVLFCFAVSTFFTNPNTAVNVGIMLWIAPPLMLQSVLTSVSPGSKSVQLATCLSPPVCLSWAFSIFTSFQDKGKEWSWSMFLEKGTTGGLSMAHIVFMFYLDWLLFAFITWYVDSVRPGRFGRAKPFYFIFQFWKKNIDNKGYTEDTDQSSFEAPPRDTKIGISIQNLRKVFGSKVAVDRVDLDIYEGEITALLGHNGAGKTTTMSILTGLFSPSKGTVIVDGCNIFENMDRFRLSLGLCPQHDLLFSYLTTIEHLVFFGMLKGLSMDHARTSGLNLLAVFHIEDKANQFVSQLSGGMKRKLCLAIALIGDPKILMLDEPTSGMDPESRRDVWDILLTYRGERTILITTHFMEEADILGDRIAIMDHGRVSCYGTSIFLKKLYGTGYQIVISKDMAKSEIDISRVIETHLNEPHLKSNLPSQLTYNVSANNVPHFSSLFEDLEARKSELGITGISIGCTTMEDVFLRVAEVGLHSDVKAIPAQVMVNPVLPAVNTKIREEGWRLILQQLRALFVKKMLVIYRSWLSTLLYVLMPLFMTLSVLVNKGWAGGNEMIIESRELSLALYPDTEVPYSFSHRMKMERKYQELVNNLGGKPQKYTTNISEALISKVEDDKSYYRKAVVGAEFNRTLITGLYNGWAFHAAPITINLITNAILKDFKSTASVAVTSHPFSGNINTDDQCDRMALTTEGNALQKALHWSKLVVGLMVIVTGFISQPLVERANNAKQLQLMTKLSPFVYWAGHFLWDFLLYLVAMVLVITAIWLLDAEEMLTPSGKMYLLFFLLLLHGISGIPFAYLITFTTKSSERAVLLFVMFNIFTGVIAPHVTLLLNLMLEPSATLVAIDALLCLNPLYAATAALIRLLTVMIKDSACYRCPEFCDSLHLSEHQLTFNWSSLQFVIFLVVEWALYWSLIFIIEFGLLKSCWGKTESLLNGPMFKSSVVEDDDVIEEKQKAKTILNNSYKEGSQPVLRVCGLGKKYNRKSVAVQEVSFLVEKGQCFGLLGVNGAGKTTTFKMLTGDEIPTVGTASILLYDLLHSKTKYLGEIGYCPQSDAIIEKLTGEEMLCLYSALRGTPLYKVDSEVDHWLHFMGLEEFAKAQCGTYSGGNKRKLSTAMALIGDPSVVFLDEPTAGVDPVSRRKLWDVLVQCQSTGQAIVLTSHSMEECEALCSRLTILVGGYMKCIGTTQYLKQKFGQGYTIKIKLSSTTDSATDLLALKNDVNRTLANCLIKDEHKGLLHYHLTDSTVLLSVLFSSLEHLQQSHSIIEDYTVGDTTLEQVFMSFAKQVPPTIVVEPVDV